MHVTTSAEFLLVALIILLSVKVYFLSILIPRGLRETNAKAPWLLLVLFLVGSMSCDIAWLCKLIGKLMLPNLTTTSIVAVRMAWGFRIIQYHALSFFIESLAVKRFALTFFNKILVAFSGTLAATFFYLALRGPLFFTESAWEKANIFSDTIPLEMLAMRAATVYLVACLIIPSTVYVIHQMRVAHLPTILRKQLRIFLSYLLLPYFVTEILQLLYYLFLIFDRYLYPVIGASTTLLVITVYYSINQVMMLRFLNLEKHVQLKTRFNFICDFKATLEVLSSATNVQEIRHITQTFFKDSFSIPHKDIFLYLRSSSTMPAGPELQTPSLDYIDSIVEQYLAKRGTTLLMGHKILVYDELAFTIFYTNSPKEKELLTLLDMLNADIFLPITENNQLHGYIIIERNARQESLYSKMEQDEMLVFSRYLSSIVHLLTTRKLETLMRNEKKIRDELYEKHREIALYKESMQNFLHTSEQKAVGILFSTPRGIVIANQIARDMLKIDPNKEQGHPLVKVIKESADQVKTYKTEQRVITQDLQGHNLVIEGMPNSEQKNCIISLYYPDIEDILNQKIPLLKQQDEWDYLLYLETTTAGKRIKKFIPCCKEPLISYKISLLRAAISTKPILLEIPSEDLSATANLIHLISMRDTLHQITITQPEKNLCVAHKLFGTSTTTVQKQALLQQLSKGGTLLIENIHYLQKETQQMLAHFLRYGTFYQIDGEEKITSNARIICATHYTTASTDVASSLIHECSHKLQMPSLLTLSDEIFLDLVNGIIKEQLQSNALQQLFELSPTQKEQLVRNRPASMHELTTRLTSIIHKKSKKASIAPQTTCNTNTTTIADPFLEQAARLGKYALRDKTVMRFLWRKFKSQNKIATFLGVNRSSVNRRCKNYHLAE